MTFLSPWSWLADGKKCLETAQKIRSRDQVGAPDQRLGFRQPVHNRKLRFPAFQNRFARQKTFKRIQTRVVPEVVLHHDHSTIGTVRVAVHIQPYQDAC